MEKSGMLTSRTQVSEFEGARGKTFQGLKTGTYDAQPLSFV